MDVKHDRMKNYERVVSSSFLSAPLRRATFSFTQERLVRTRTKPQQVWSKPSGHCRYPEGVIPWRFAVGMRGLVNHAARPVWRKGRVRGRCWWRGVVTSVELIGAPGAWVALRGVHVLEHVRGAFLGSKCGTTTRRLREVIAMLCMPRAYSTAKCVRLSAMSCSQTSVSRVKSMLPVSNFGPSCARVILWELDLHEQRHNVGALN